MDVNERVSRILKKEGFSTLLRKSGSFLRAQIKRSIFQWCSPEHGMMAVRDKISDVGELTNSGSPVIVDGGANIGNVTKGFLDEFDNPEIHAFEPIPRLAEEMRNRFSTHPNVHVHEVALGPTEKTVEFNVVENLVSSSVLTPSQTKRRYHGNQVATKSTIKVEQVKLDNIISEANVIKVDLQGYELPALRGAENLLSDVDVVLSEVEFTELYEDQALFRDVTDFLADHGFELFNLYEIFTEEDGQVAWADAIYTK